MKDVSSELAVRVALAMSCRRMAEIDTIMAEVFRREASALLSGHIVKHPALPTKDAMAYICQSLGIFGDDYFEMRLKIFDIPLPEDDMPICEYDRQAVLDDALDTGV